MHKIILPIILLPYFIISVLGVFIWERSMPPPVMIPYSVACAFYFYKLIYKPIKDEIDEENRFKELLTRKKVR